MTRQRLPDVDIAEIERIATFGAIAIAAATFLSENPLRGNEGWHVDPVWWFMLAGLLCLASAGTSFIVGLNAALYNAGREYEGPILHYLLDRLATILGLAGFITFFIGAWVALMKFF